MRRYPGGGAFALFFHPQPREFDTQIKKRANARGLARGRGGERAHLELTDALLSIGNFMCTFWSSFPVLTIVTKPNIRRKTNPNGLYRKAFLANKGCGKLRVNRS